MCSGRFFCFVVSGLSLCFFFFLSSFVFLLSVFFFLFGFVLFFFCCFSLWLFWCRVLCLGLVGFCDLCPSASCFFSCLFCCLFFLFCRRVVLVLFALSCVYVFCVV